MDEVTPVCEACGGVVAYLGRLGSLTHWRCIGCGWDTAIAYQHLDAETREVVDEVGY